MRGQRIFRSSSCLRHGPTYVDVYPPNLSGFRRQSARASGKGAIPTGRCLKRSRPNGRIAQVVEQLTLNQRVVGSSPTAPTNSFQWPKPDDFTRGLEALL